MRQGGGEGGIFANAGHGNRTRCKEWGGGGSGGKTKPGVNLLKEGHMPEKSVGRRGERAPLR